MAGTVHEHERTALLQDAETRAYPAVFRGLVKAWPATTLWKGLEGLSYLKAAAGHATVQAMYAPSTNFFGDIQQHQSVACTLGELLDIAAQQQQQQGEAAAAGGTSAGQTAAAAAEQAAVEQPITGATAASSEGFAAMHLYLAQQSLFCPGLSKLLADTPTPEFLQQKQLTAANLWFSSRPSRSSTHYDPYQSLLCVVTGTKRLKLFRPDAVLGLYPQALGGEASNHSSVDFVTPDLAKHPLYRHVLDQSIDVTLNPGDALFIPEGWWHQVDSDSLTFAVNFWWQSDLTAQLVSVPHQHHYYLRQLLASTSSEVVELLLAGIQPWKPPIVTTGAKVHATEAQADETAAVATAEEMQAAAATSVVQAAAAPGASEAAQAIVSGKPLTAAAAGARAAATQDAPEAVTSATAAAAHTARAEQTRAAADPEHSDPEQADGNAWTQSRKRRRRGIAEHPTALPAHVMQSTLTTRPQSPTAVATAGGVYRCPPTVEQQAEHAQHLSLSIEYQLADRTAGISDPAQNSSGSASGSSAGCSRSSSTNSTSSGGGSSSSSSGSGTGIRHEEQENIVVHLNQLERAALQELQDAVRSEVLHADGTTDAHHKFARFVEASQHSRGQPEHQQYRHGISQGAAEAERGDSSASGHDPLPPDAASAAASVSASGGLVSSSWSQQQQKAQQQLLWAAVSRPSALRATTTDDGSVAPVTADNPSLPHRTNTAARCSCSGRHIVGREGNKVVYAAEETQCNALGLSSRVSSLLAALEPVQLLQTLWIAAGPTDQGGRRDVVQTLLQQGLTPVVAHMLTQMLEQADEHFAHDTAFGSEAVDGLGLDQGVGEKVALQGWTAQQHAMDMQRLPFTREHFYGRLYGTVPDTGAVLDRIVAGKATLSLAAAKLIVQCQVNTTL